MEITINAVELASNLAEKALWDEISSPLSNELITSEEDLYNFDEQGNGTYKPKFQEIFERWYDYFFNEILKTDINEDTSFS